MRSARFFAVEALLAVSASVVPGALGALAYLRAAVLRGEWWRLLTTHLVHAGVAHLAWNLAGLLLVFVAVAPLLSPRGWLAVAVVSALAASLGVLWLSPGTAAMAGLSAVLHGQLAGGACVAVRRHERLGWAVLALIAAKLVVERLAPLPWDAGLGGAGIAVDAHLYGSLGGVAAGLALLRRRVPGKGGAS